MFRWNWSSDYWEKKFCNVFPYFVIISTCERTSFSTSTNLNKNFHHPRMRCVKYGCNWPMCYPKMISWMYFRYFVIICHLKKKYSLNPYHPRMICNCPSERWWKTNVWWKCLKFTDKNMRSVKLTWAFRWAQVN